MQLIDSIKAYAYGSSKELVRKRKDSKCENLMKKIKKWLLFIILQKKT